LPFRLGCSCVKAGSACCAKLRPHTWSRLNRVESKLGSTFISESAGLTITALRFTLDPNDADCAAEPAPIQRHKWLYRLAENAVGAIAGSDGELLRSGLRR